jgi:hypothetical protein
VRRGVGGAPGERTTSDRVGTVIALAAPARPTEVQAWLDVACPWCWLAQRRFEAHHSLELAPDPPADYLSSEADFLQLLHPGMTREEVEQMMRVRSTGAPLGLAFGFDRVQHATFVPGAPAARPCQGQWPAVAYARGALLGVLRAGW